MFSFNGEAPVLSNFFKYYAKYGSVQLTFRWSYIMQIPDAIYHLIFQNAWHIKVWHQHESCKVHSFVQETVQKLYIFLFTKMILVNKLLSFWIWWWIKHHLLWIWSIMDAFIPLTKSTWTRLGQRSLINPSIISIKSITRITIWIIEDKTKTLKNTYVSSQRFLSPNYSTMSLCLGYIAFSVIYFLNINNNLISPNSHRFVLIQKCTWPWTPQLHSVYLHFHSYHCYLFWWFIHSHKVVICF